MRLSEFEREAIKECIKRYFGEKSEVFLFGSRVDDTKKGGDIDIYVIAEYKDINEILLKIKAKRCIKSKIGEQRIDIMVSKDTNSPIEKIARENGVRL